MSEKIIIMDGCTHIDLAKDLIGRKQAELIKSLEEHKGVLIACNAGNAFRALGVSAKQATKAMQAFKVGFSQLETSVLDSISEPEIPYIEESAFISKKSWKKLSKKIKKQLNIEPQTQAEIWGNKWDKKLKKNL